MSSSEPAWGPSHQYLSPPRDSKGHLVAFAVAAVLVLLEHTLALYALGLLSLLVLGRVLQRHWDSPGYRTPAPSPPPADAAALRARSSRLGGGAYLGVHGGEWVTADPEHAVMVLGPPRSGKTSAIVIPSVLAAPGPVVSTATKPDVLDATFRSRSEVGQVWLYDPSGERTEWPQGVRRLCWSPIPAARTWDGALLMARAMASSGSSSKGTTNEHHWRERSTALLAPLLHAASITDRPITQVLTWVLRGELDPATSALSDHGSQVAADVLSGIAKTDDRERSSIFSATAGTLSAYNADATRRNATQPNFDAHRFVASRDTIYITAPAHKQALCAPLVVGLLEEIRHATYHRAADPQAGGHPPVYLCLDEAANIAPIHDLPELVSEAGGQGLHVMVCLQDLSQARKRWGEHAADGFLSLFQTKLILNGVADPKTLDSISLALGEYDRRLVTQTLGRSETHSPFDFYKLPKPSDTDSIAYHTHRERTLPPGDIARLPPGRALHLQGTCWELIRTTPFHRTLPWKQIASTPVLRVGAINEDGSSSLNSYIGPIY